jgi:cation:H+ antiporter
MGEEIIQLTSELRLLLLLMTIVVFAIFMIGDKMGAMKAYALLFIYLNFVLYVIGRSTGNELAWNVAQWLRYIVDLIPIRLG